MLRGLAVLVAIAMLSAVTDAKPSNFMLASRMFVAGGTMPRETAYSAQSCGGDNISPDLRWSAPPPGTKSLAMTLWDPDAPAAGGWWHWVLYNLPASARNLAKSSAIGTSGTTSFGTTGYGGPCPPPGRAHHYVFTLYALDIARIDAPAPLRGPELQQRLRGHVLAKATLTGLYAR